MSKILGIDEAGRGPVLGPLVLCGVAVDSTELPRLEALGVRDSKAFGSGARAHERRRAVAEAIGAFADIRLAVAEPEEIDRWTAEGGLNRLEQKLATDVIESGDDCEIIWADGERLFAPLKGRFPQLRAENRADREHSIVAAASIVAKVERDERLATLLSAVVEEASTVKGGGYPNAATARLLRSHVERHGRLPPGVRRSWSWSVLRELEDQLGESLEQSGEGDE